MEAEAMKAWTRTTNKHDVEYMSKEEIDAIIRTFNEPNADGQMLENKICIWREFETTK